MERFRETEIAMQNETNQIFKLGVLQKENKQLRNELKEMNSHLNQLIELIKNQKLKKGVL